MNIKATIKVNKLDKSAFFKGKNGDTYCSIILWENRDGEDQFGNTHSIKQDLGKDRKGEKSDYVGNAKPIGGGQGRDVPANEAVKRTAPAQRDNQASEPDDCDDIPFSSRHDGLPV
jgi:hypothetical protein